MELQVTGTVLHCKLIITHKGIIMFTKADLSLAYENYNGPVIVAKIAKPRKGEKTFRNNKYSVFNRGRMKSNFGVGGIHAYVDKIA